MTGAFEQMVTACTVGDAPVAAQPRKTALDGLSTTEQVLTLLKENSLMRTAELADAVGLTTRLVWGLLKSRRATGQVLFADGYWRLSEGFAETSIEMLEWFPISNKPDSDITVIGWGSNGAFTAYWDDGIPAWIDCATGGQTTDITHYSQPEGPTR